MRVFLVLGGAFAFVILAQSSPVLAITYKNMTTNTVLFADDFEGVSAIGVGFDDDLGTTDFDPVATTGTWEITEGLTVADDNHSLIQVTDFDGTTTTSVDYPGTIQGDNYMWVNRDGIFNKAVGLAGGVQDTNGDNIHIEWMTYIRPFSGGGPGVFNLYEGATASGDRIAGIAASDDGTLSDGSGLTWTADTWQKWEFDFVVGDSTYSLTIAGTQATGIANHSSSGVSAGAIRFSSNSNTEYFIDAVPEPMRLEVNRVTGRMQIANRSAGDLSMYFYRISGDVDSLDSVNWDSLDEQDYDAIGAGIGESWDEAGGSDSSLLAEAYLKSNSTLNPDESVSLGFSYDDGQDKQGLTFEYRDAVTRELVEGLVEYIIPGDMNNDGDVDDLDVNLFVQALTDRVAFDAAHPDVDADFIGDFNGNGRLDLGDLSDFKAAVLAAGSASSQASSVPEPSTALLMILSGVGLIGLCRTRSVE